MLAYAPLQGPPEDQIVIYAEEPPNLDPITYLGWPDMALG